MKKIYKLFAVGVMGTVISSCGNKKLPNSGNLGTELNNNDSEENKNEVTSSYSDDTSWSLGNTSWSFGNSSDQNDTSSDNPGLTSGGQTAMHAEEPVKEEKPVDENKEEEVEKHEEIKEEPVKDGGEEKPVDEKKDEHVKEGAEVRGKEKKKEEPVKNEKVEKPVEVKKDEKVKPVEVKKDEKVKPVDDKNGNIVISELKMEHVALVWDSGTGGFLKRHWVGVKLKNNICLGKKITISPATYNDLWKQIRDKNKKGFDSFSGVKIFDSNTKVGTKGRALMQIAKNNIK